MDKSIEFDNHKDLQGIFGQFDQNIKLIEKELHIKVIREESGLRVTGNTGEISKAIDLFNYLRDLIKTGAEVKHRDVVYAIKMAKGKEPIDFKQLAKSKIEVPLKDMLVTPKTKGQFDYVESIKNHDIVFGCGPAGTGKTYLAMAMAVNAFKRGLVRRIVLTRPAIEAGENLGFLPGDMMEKVSPYVRPLYDALYDMMDTAKVDELIEDGVIEVAPLAFMRGRTLNDAFVVLDEAQNATPFQMKMFLTRLGFDSKTVITGDVTQSDLPKGTTNGLEDACRILKDVDGIDFVHLTGEDVVRHELVQRIIEAYEHTE
ncbi:MAG: phosphate starvation-inducible PhoH-like protein [Candidatus Omnitrophota bacterium]|jgi:phosphate starvation-inducible PhoH-like protein